MLNYCSCARSKRDCWRPKQWLNLVRDKSGNYSYGYRHRRQVWKPWKSNMTTTSTAQSKEWRSPRTKKCRTWTSKYQTITPKLSLKPTTFNSAPRTAKPIRSSNEESYISWRRRTNSCGGSCRARESTFRCRSWRSTRCSRRHWWRASTWWPGMTTPTPKNSPSTRIRINNLKNASIATSQSIRIYVIDWSTCWIRANSKIPIS